MINKCLAKSASEILFVGAFDAIKNARNDATSSAGNQVQMEIFDEIKKLNQFNCKIVKSISLNPIKSWPHGKFFWDGMKNDEGFFPPFINISGLKRLIFSCFLFFYLLKNRPIIIVKYNLSAIEALTLLIYRAIAPSAFLAAIIQDVNYSKNKGISFKQITELYAMKLAVRFDMLIPISEKIKNDFRFPPKKTRVFNGGLTRQGRSILSAKTDSLSHIAVFAGALEKYNGIDILIKQWISQNIDMELHIFGKGSYESYVLDASTHNAKIIFHGFRPEEEVSNYQKVALINFCLRYSNGIDAGYFFPSKLFNVICAPGAVMANQFEGFPCEIEGACTMLTDDLENLHEQLKNVKLSSSLHLFREQRKQWITENANWKPIVQDIFERASERNGVSL